MTRKTVHSLYVHVPFCRKKCLYCDFYSTTLEKSDYRSLILKELNLRNPSFSQFPTVYFGGGTPSLMAPDFFEAVLSKLAQFSEVTVEFNPEDASPEKLRALKEIGVNRISLGVQSLSERTLKALGREGKPRETLKALERALTYFSNVSVDLIFGAPYQSPESFFRELSTILSFPVKHVSLYALTLYRETPLWELAKRGKVELPEEERVRQMYYGSLEILKEHGFKQYEISNFALDGFFCRHNLSYWKLKNYLGLGPSGASFVDGEYFQNVSELKTYREKVERGELPTQTREKLTGLELIKTKLIMGLRLTEGVEIEGEVLEKLTKSEMFSVLVEEGFLELKMGRLKLKEKAYFVSNSVISQLLTSLED